MEAGDPHIGARGGRRVSLSAGNGRVLATSEALLDFFGTCLKANFKERHGYSRQTFDYSFPMHSSMPRPAPAS
jgi:hypothetical protein